MNFFVEGHRRRRYSVERLRLLYADLLHTIDISNDDIGGRRRSDNRDHLDGNSSTKNAKSYTRNLLRNPLHFMRKNRKESKISNNPSTEKRDLAAAFRVLSATPFFQKEGGNGGALAVRDDAAVAALALARTVEAHVIELVRSIGEVVVYGEQAAGKRNSIRGDAVFEYFCEKSMLALLVEIAKSKPSATYDTDGTGPKFHGVVWTPHVKAQVLQTISILVSNVKDQTSLYYLLSNNYVNDLVVCILPMRQWTDPALEEIMPIYVNFLKTLALQLAKNPQLFPFLKQEREDESSPFPVFSAALEVATSSLAQSDSFVHITCLNLVVNVLQISNPLIRAWVSTTPEQSHLASHLCQRLLHRYYRLATLTRGSIVDPLKSSAIVGQLTGLHDQLEFLNDVLWCGVRSLNVRICEYLLQRLVYTLLQNIPPQQNTNGQHQTNVEMLDGDNISESKALAQVSIFYLSQLFLKLEYAPFLRMLAVAILHPDSPTDWTKLKAPKQLMSEEYILTPALNAIVQKSKHSGAFGRTGEETESEVIPNPFRKEILALLQGKEGDWRFIPASILLESILKSDAFDLETLMSLHIIPRFSKEPKFYPPSPCESAIESYLNHRHEHSSSVSALALECAGSLSLTILANVVDSCTNKGKDFGFLRQMLQASPLVHGLGSARSHFCTHAIKLQGAAGVSEHFLDLIELAITSRYSIPSDGAASAAAAIHGDKGNKAHVCSLPKFACTAQGGNSEVLIRKFHDVSSNDVEDARFAIRMALHYRAICKTVEHLHEDLICALGPSAASPRWVQDTFKFDTLDVADDLLSTIGGLKAKPEIGTDLNLRGRTVFSFLPASGRIDPSKLRGQLSTKPNERKRKFSEELLRPNVELVLVLDPTDLFVVKPAIGKANEADRGTILCSAPLSSVIAFACDGKWLHIAIRKMDDIGYLIKNGNMALRFESVGSCLIVRQYLERSRTVLQRDLVEQIRLLFAGNPEELLFKNAQIESSQMMSDGEEYGDFADCQVEPACD